MSAKVSRKTTAQSSASSSTMFSTPQEPTSSHHRSRSPLSPTRVSRMAEKHELQSLNDRLAVYMDTVRALEKENSRLVKQVEISQETINKEKTAYRTMYEQELSDARHMLDDIASSRARLEIENKRLREENEDLKSGLDKTTKECRKLETSLNVLEHRFADLQTKYNKAANDLKSRDDDLKELERVKKQLELQRKYVENETLSRVELENKLQSLKEDANFKQTIYEQEVTQLRTKRSQEISEIDGRLSTEYEDKLQVALKELRENYEAQLLDNRNQLISIYENKLRRLEEHTQKNVSGTQAAVEELRSVQARFDSVSSQLATAESTNANLTARIRDLERQLEHERTRGVERLAACEQELASLREDMTSQLKDYQDLMEIKVALDSELNAYRKLLEFEEHRLNITPGVTSPLVAARRGTPTRRGTPLLGKASKRRRIMLDESEATDTFQVSGEARTDIEISDVDPEGKFVQLLNKGEKELTIGGWSIKHTVGEGDAEQETSFKLHRSVKIEAGGKVTVWAADAGHAHEPPTNIVMKQKWFTGDYAVTVLTNSDGEEVARRQRQRVVSSSYRQEFDDDADPQAELQRQECCIM